MKHQHPKYLKYLIARMPDAKYQQGFTLLEVMVALAIFAVAAIAITKVTMNYSQSIGQMQDRTFAHFVAMNELARMEIAGEWPEGTGEKTLDEQGGQWLVSHQVINTLSQDVRRIEIRVAEGNKDLSAGTKPPVIASVTGFLKRPVLLTSNIALSAASAATPNPTDNSHD